MGVPRDYSLTFAGAGEREWQATGRYVRVLATPSAPAFIRIDGGSELERGAGQGINVPEGFSRISVRTAVAQTVVISISDAPQDDNRTVVDLAVSATVAGATAATKVAAVTIAAGATEQLCPANADRQEVRIGIASDQPGGVWFSDDPGQGADEGGFLDAGTVDYPATTAALYAHNPHPTDDVVVNVLDLESP